MWGVLDLLSFTIQFRKALVICDFTNNACKTLIEDLVSCVMRKPDFAYTKIKVHISCVVTAQLNSAFDFAT